MKGLLAAIEDRLGLVSAWWGFADMRVRGGAKLRHAFPAVIAYLFVQQAVLGVALAAYYSPSSTDAWASTAYITDQVTLGWFVRGLHFHGASVMVIVATLWVLQLVAHGAYRAPREVTWWAALGVLGLSLAFALSGNPLPWDQQGYWGIQVELGIAQQSPGGGAIRTLIQGGSDTGNLSLLRFYVIHVFLLPGAFIGLLALVVLQLRRHGPAAPINMSAEQADRTARRWFPGQTFIDVVAITAVSLVLIVLTLATHGAELWAPADPSENFQARPEWYFLFLYVLRSPFQGPLEPIATMLVPGAAVTFLLAVPFVERLVGKAGRAVVLGGVGLLMTGVVLLTGIGIAADYADDEYRESLVESKKRADEARAYAKEGVDPLGGPAVFFNDPQYRAKKLFREHCQNCHGIDGIGGGEGPDFTDYGSKAWLLELIKDPNTDRFFGKTKMKDEMSSYKELPEADLAALVDYVVSLSGDPEMTADPKLVARAKELWDGGDPVDCSGCHEVEQGKAGDGPNLVGRGTKEWVARVIRDSAAEDLFADYAEMPKFKDKLSEEEIELLAEFVVSQRK
jgi:ubiquinol-cytochrome c reductase cytochrome b subunit